MTKLIETIDEKLKGCDRRMEFRDKVMQDTARDEKTVLTALRTAVEALEKDASAYNRTTLASIAKTLGV